MIEITKMIRIIKMIKINEITEMIKIIKVIEMNELKRIIIKIQEYKNKLIKNKLII